MDLTPDSEGLVVKEIDETTRRSKKGSWLVTS